MNNSNNPVAETARQQMRSLADAGAEAYKNQQKLRAAELYKKALEIAESIDDSPSITRYRFWWSTNLYDLGRLREALTVIAPIIQGDKVSGEADYVFGALTNYLSIAQELPVSLKAIEKVFTHAEGFIQSSGNYNWRHNLFSIRSDLYVKRGMQREALNIAQESKSVWEDKYPLYTADGMFSKLVSLSLSLRDTEQAREYLKEWEQHPSNPLPKSREQLLYKRQSDLARFEGRTKEAIDWARRAVLIAEQSDTKDEALFSIKGLIRAFLAEGDCDRARGMVVQYTAIRHSESAFDRYSLHLLVGDYHLACARKTAGWLPVDDEYGLTFSQPVRSNDLNTMRRALIRTKLAYNSALKIGKEIDIKLECNSHQDEVIERQRRIQFISDAL
jgi:tetratricopeptide (TPR) repeat protein